MQLLQYAGNQMHTAGNGDTENTILELPADVKATRIADNLACMIPEAMHGNGMNTLFADEHVAWQKVLFRDAIGDGLSPATGVRAATRFTSG